MRRTKLAKLAGSGSAGDARGHSAAGSAAATPLSVIERIDARELNMRSGRETSSAVGITIGSYSLSSSTHGFLEDLGLSGLLMFTCIIFSLRRFLPLLNATCASTS